MLSCRHRNTAAGSHRNVFIEDAQVVFVNKYHKGVEITSDVKIIHRYLAREIGELAVWYLSDRMKGLIYARDVVELVGSSGDRRRRFRKVSEDWHRFLGFESTAVEDERRGPTKRKWCGFEDDAEDERVRRRARLRRMDAQAELS
ncbi:hypothetical protein LTR49_023092 [Elasticomyces elasticus]|nr:hypothetical protein LTR49_023092 [Elasticomyces elasticus]